MKKLQYNELFTDNNEIIPFLELVTDENIKIDSIYKNDKKNKKNHLINLEYGLLDLLEDKELEIIDEIMQFAKEEYINKKIWKKYVKKRNTEREVIFDNNIIMNVIKTTPINLIEKKEMIIRTHKKYQNFFKKQNEEWEKAWEKGEKINHTYKELCEKFNKENGIKKTYKEDEDYKSIILDWHYDDTNSEQSILDEYYNNKIKDIYANSLYNKRYIETYYKHIILKKEYKDNTDLLFSFFDMLFKSSLPYDIAKCNNCNKYFVTINLNTHYCNRKYQDNLTCKEYQYKYNVNKLNNYNPKFLALRKKVYENQRKKFQNNQSKKIDDNQNKNKFLAEELEFLKTKPNDMEQLEFLLKIYKTPKNRIKALKDAKLNEYLKILEKSDLLSEKE